MFEDNAKKEMDRARQSMRHSQQRMHENQMLGIESAKLKEQRDFNEMYKKRLEDLEADAKWNNLKFIISSFLALGAIVLSIIAL